MNYNEIESALLMSSIYKDISSNIMQTKNISENELKEQVINYLKQICYTGKKKSSNPGLLEKMKASEKIVSAYNKSFRNEQTGRQIFSKSEVTDYESPLKMQDLSEEFSEENLNTLSLQELLARAMHWSNRIAKVFEEKIDDDKNYKFKKSAIEKDVYPKLLSKNLDEFYEMYIDYEGMTDSEIKADIGDKKFNEYIESRKKVVSAIKDARIKIKEEDLSDYIHLFVMLDAKSNAYALKSKFMQRCILEALKNSHQKDDLYQYIKIDKDKSINDSYKYVYGIALKDHTEPFEVHANSRDIEGCIQIADSILKRECEIDCINDVTRFKSQIPRKFKEEEKKIIERLDVSDGDIFNFVNQVNDLTGYIKENSSRINERFTAVGTRELNDLGDDI